MKKKDEKDKEKKKSKKKSMRGKKEKGKKMNKKKSSKQSLTMMYSSDYNQTAPRQGWTPSLLVSAKAFSTGLLTVTSGIKDYTTCISNENQCGSITYYVFILFCFLRLFIVVGTWYQFYFFQRFVFINC